MVDRHRYSVFPRDRRLDLRPVSNRAASTASPTSTSSTSADSSSWPLPPTRKDYIFGLRSNTSLSSRSTLPAELDTPRTSVASSGAHYQRERLHDADGLSDVSSCVTSPDDWMLRLYNDTANDDSITDECPDGATLASVFDIPIYDALGRARPFGHLYEPGVTTHPRQLVIFIRHFYCGACQAYVRAMARGISLRDYLSIPVPTNIVIIGCGQPDLITHYKKATRCPWPVYAEPSRTLFRKLGMAVSINLGVRTPGYMENGTVAWLAGQVTSIRRSLQDPDGIRTRDIWRGGNFMQIGGEFLFEKGEVIWCHRMRTYRDHTEVAELRKIVELDQ